MFKYIFGLSLAAGLLITACTKSTIVGTEILEGDFVDVAFLDDTQIKMKTVPADSVRIYPSGNDVFLLGNVDDPIYGRSSTEIYFQIRKITETPILKDAILDSVVLSMVLDSDGNWGDSLAMQNMEVYELAESLDLYDTIYSNQQFMKGELLGTKSFNPYLMDSSTVVVDGDTTYYQNVVRIPLVKSYGDRLAEDTLAFNNDTMILEKTNGILIRSMVDGNSVIGINNGSFLDDHSNKLMFYFTKDGNPITHVLTLGGKRGQYVERDFSSAVVNDYIYNGDESDSLLYLSGMVNTNLSLDIPDLQGLEDVLINYAELEFFVAEPDGALPYEKVQQIYLYNRNEDGVLVLTEDLAISLEQGAPNYFDGQLKEVSSEDGMTSQRYAINITNELKERIQEQNTETKLVLSPFLTQGRANRTVLYGPEHTLYPAKLKITYTKQ